MASTIRLGVYDWTQFCPELGYYPDDLPEEWRLSYFANEFAAACIALSNLNQDFKLFYEWMDDLPHDFALSFFVAEESDLELLSRLIEQSDVAIDSILVPQQQSLLLEPIKLMGLNSVVYESMWSPENPGKDCQMALISKQNNLRMYRDCIETWMSSTSNTQSELTLWLKAPGLDYQELDEVKTLIELMGY